MENKIEISKEDCEMDDGQGPLNPESSYVFVVDVDFDELGKVCLTNAEISKKMFAMKQNQVDQDVRDKWALEQKNLKASLVMEDQFSGDLTKDNFADNLKYIGAADISFHKNDKSKSKCVAALIICEYPSMKVVYEDYESDKELDQPYIPGFLAFREVPIYDPLFKRLKQSRADLWPQVLMVDGNGIMHTREFGLASHLGVLYGVPTIGCAKTPFAVDGLTKTSILDQVDKECPNGGDHTLLIGDSGKTWGAALLPTGLSSQPLFISIGHRVCLSTALEVTKLTMSDFKIPEPIRQADLRGRDLVRKLEKNSN